MLAQLDCIPCLCRDTLNATRRATDDPAMQQAILGEALFHLAMCDPATSPPALARDLQGLIAARARLRGPASRLTAPDDSDCWRHADRPAPLSASCSLMKIALPLTEQNEFSAHYGGASRVAIFEVDRATRRLLSQSVITPPSPEPCVWPAWLQAQGIQVVLVGGMGGGPRQRLAALGVDVVPGVPAGDPTELVQAYLQGRLQLGANACESGHGEHAHGHAHGSDHAHDGGCGCGE